jgi:hypothetical protein
MFEVSFFSFFAILIFYATPQNAMIGVTDKHLPASIAEIYTFRTLCHDLQ